MAIYSDMNGFPESGFPVLADVSDRICLNTLYSNPLKSAGYIVDYVGASRLGTVTITNLGAMASITTIGASGTVSLSSATAPLTLSGATAVLSITGQNASIQMSGLAGSIGTPNVRIPKGYFKQLTITEKPLVGDVPLASMGDLGQYLKLDCSNDPLTGGLDVGDNSLIVDTTTLVVNVAGYEDKVGIGTATPSQKLDVNGNIRANALYLTNTANPFIYVNDGTSEGYFQSVSGNFNFSNVTAGYGITFSTNSLERMRIDSAGNVGIGEITPTAKLHVKDAGTVAYGGYVLGIHADNHDPYLAGFFNDTWSTTVPVFSYFGFNDGTFAMGTDGVEDFYFYTRGYANRRMTITSTGNVGIGVADPDAKLEVSGNIHLSAYNDKILLGLTLESSIYNDGTDLWIDPDEVGSGILRIGANVSCKGAGTLSEKFGELAQATGYGSTAVGNGALAYRNFSTAIGCNTQAGVDAYTTGTKNIAIGYLAVAGTVNLTIGATALGTQASAQGDYSFAMGAFSTTTAANQFVCGGASSDSAFISDVFFGSGVTDIAPVGFTFHATGGSGADCAGASLTISGGISTGSGLGGSIILQTTPAGASSSVANTPVTRLTIDSTGASTFTGDVTAPNFIGVATTASYAVNASTAVVATTALYALTGGFALSANSASGCSFATSALSANTGVYALTAGYALTSPGGTNYWANTGTSVVLATTSNNVIIGAGPLLGNNASKVLGFEVGVAPISPIENIAQVYAVNSADTRTVLLLHGEGPDGSGTVLDSSYTPHTVNTRGNVVLDTAQKKFGAASIYFPGSNGDCLETADSDDWYFAEKNWTIDFWIRLNHVTSGMILATQIVDANNYWQIYKGASDNKISIGAKDSSTDRAQYVMTNPWGAAANQWYHLAVVRNLTTALLFIDGSIQTLTETVAFAGNTMANIGTSMIIGGRRSSLAVNGWIDEFRISKGIARWVANFTSPTVAYSDSNNMAELRVMDGMGNVTTLSPHNFKDIPDDKKYKLMEDSDGMAWTFHSEKNEKSITVDMFNAIRDLEAVTNKKYIYTNKDK